MFCHHDADVVPMLEMRSLPCYTHLECKDFMVRCAVEGN